MRTLPQDIPFAPTSSNKYPAGNFPYIILELSIFAKSFFLTDGFRSFKIIFLKKLPGHSKPGLYFFSRSLIISFEILDNSAGLPFLNKNSAPTIIQSFLFLKIIVR